MADLISYGLLCFGVFVGAFVSGLAGFAFSAVAAYSFSMCGRRPKPCL